MIRVLISCFIKEAFEEKGPSIEFRNPIYWAIEEIKKGVDCVCHVLGMACDNSYYAWIPSEEGARDPILVLNSDYPHSLYST